MPQQTTSSPPPLLHTENICMHFPVRSGVFRQQTAVLKAVDSITLNIQPAQTLGIVGESGCGKTTLARCLVRLHKPTGGDVFFEGKKITKMNRKNLLPYRRRMQMIFQDPADSLNQRMSVADLLREPLQIHRVGNPAEQTKKIATALDSVGLPKKSADLYPFEFSGGQRQRIGIARALMLHPSLIICDEPVSALDVSVQSQIINLLLELQREHGIAYVFIAHDLAVVRHVSDLIAVMYLGKIIELATPNDIFKNPIHAYTRALLDAIPSTWSTDRGARIRLRGEPPSPISPPPGCAFGYRMQHPRYSETIKAPPKLEEISPGHFVRQCPCCCS